MDLDHCRNAIGGMGGQNSRGLAASAFAAAAARAVALSQAGADGGLPLLTSGGGLGLGTNLAPADARSGLNSRDGKGPSRYATSTAQNSFGSNVMPTAQNSSRSNAMSQAQNSFGSNVGLRGGAATGPTTARSSGTSSGRGTPKLLF